MAAGVAVFAERKSGPGGPFNRDSPGVRAAPKSMTRSSGLRVAPGKYVLDTFGRFPCTVPTVFILNYVQAHHLDLDFYDRLFKPGAYLRTPAEHMARWHGDPDEE